MTQQNIPALYIFINKAINFYIPTLWSNKIQLFFRLSICPFVQFVVQFSPGHNLAANDRILEETLPNCFSCISAASRANLYT